MGDENFNYIEYNGMEYISAKDIDRIVLELANFTWIFAYTNKENSWCILHELNEDHSVKNEYPIQNEFIGGEQYVLRDIFETDVLQKIQIT